MYKKFSNSYYDVRNAYKDLTNHTKLLNSLNKQCNKLLQKIKREFSINSIKFTMMITQKRKQEILTRIYNSFMDLSSILDLTNEEMKINSSLNIEIVKNLEDIAAVAQFVPDTRTIKLVIDKKLGGNLAHEWFHYIDKLLGEKYSYNSISSDLTYSDFLYDGNRQHQVLIESIKNIVNKDRDYFRRSLEADNTYIDWKTNKIFHSLPKVPKYYALNRELVARAFEVYVVRLMAKKGINNTFLCDFSNDEFIVLQNIDGEIQQIRIYPTVTEDERIFFCVNFDFFIGKLKLLKFFKEGFE